MPNNIRSIREKWSASGLLIVFLAVSLALASCAASRTAVITDDPQAAFQAAIADARTASPEEICTTLTPVTAHTPGLIWQDPGSPGLSRVLVVTWTGKSYYDGQDGNNHYQLPAGAAIWVTLAPQLRDFFRNSPASVSGRPYLRVEQLLGLPPDSGKDRFVEIWVDPADLVRPAPDPEVTDREAGLDLIDNGRFLKYETSALITDSLEGESRQYTYPEWFLTMKDRFYDSGYAAPWTRLGYTYDWGNPDSEKGLSEYIIFGPAEIGIRSVQGNREYLGR